MEVNPEGHAAIMEVVNTQIHDGDPPETKQAYDRLLAAGCDDQEARRLIGCVVVAEIFDVLKQGQPFDRERYAAALARLPELPWEE